MKIFALVGRPNVGKSTLFNKLAKKRIAIVDRQPGVTRDRNTAVVDYEGYRFILIDTGGFEPDSQEVILQKMREQSQLAVEEADGIVFLADRTFGWTPQDRDIYDYLRRSEKPVYFAVNKVDSRRHLSEIAEFYESGAETVFPISGEHSRGIASLLEAMEEDFKEIRPEEREREERNVLSLAIVGRQNVGKSSIVNQFIGTGRQIVDETPGTTRDPVDNYIRYNGQEVRLIDTAGLKKKSRVSFVVDKYSMIAAIRSIERADVVLLTIDATEGVVEQDARIAGYVLERGKAMIIAVNKWDIVEKDSTTLERMRKRIKERLAFVDFAPVVFVSAKTGRRIPVLLEKTGDVYRQYAKRIQTADLNRIVHSVTSRHTPPSKGGRSTKIFYATQVATHPPSFVIKTNNPRGIGVSYQRFVTGQLRRCFDFEGTPIRLFWRENSSKNPRGGANP